MTGTAKLASGSIAGHLFTQAMPMVVGIAAIMSIGIIDAYFVGQLGPRDLAAMSFVFPATTALSSLGVGIIAGVSSVVSRAMGAGKIDQAKRLANLGVALGLLVGLVIGGLLLAFHHQLFALMQAKGATLHLIDIYMVPYALGFPFLLAAMGVNGALRAQGAAKSSTAILLTFAVANWILDPLLINGGLGLPAFGIVGASLATVAGWALGCALSFGLLQLSQLPLDLRATLRAEWRSGTAAIGRVAAPAAFSNAINPLGLSILTSLLASEGPARVAGFGVGGRLETLAVVPMLALSGAIGAIVGQNWGARQTSRAQRALLYSTGFCVLYGIVIALVLIHGRQWFAGRFTDNAQVVSGASRYLAIAAWGYAGYGVLIVINGALNAIDRAPLALVLSAGRVFLIMVPFAWLMRPHLGPEAVYYAELACNLAGCLAGALAAWQIFGGRRKNTARSGHEAPLGSEGRS